MILYAIYKKQPNGITIGVNLLHEDPRKDVSFCNVVLGAAGRHGEAKFRRSAAGLGQGRVLGWLGTGLVWIWE
jgi:hypothetical protein